MTGGVQQQVQMHGSPAAARTPAPALQKSLVQEFLAPNQMAQGFGNRTFSVTPMPISGAKKIIPVERKGVNRKRALDANQASSKLPPKRPKLPPKDLNLASLKRQSPKHIKLSPMCTPRRKPGVDMLDSMNLPVTRDITEEWKAFKKEIITPPWKHQTSLSTKRVDSLDEEPSSEEEEEISDETYFRWHERSYRRDCKRIQEVLDKIPVQKKQGRKTTKKCTKPKAAEKKTDPATQPNTKLVGLAQPVSYNYNMETSWRRPEHYIRFVDPNAPAKPQTAAIAEKTVMNVKFQLSNQDSKQCVKTKPREKKESKSKKKRGRKKRQKATKISKPPSDESSKALAAMRLEYEKLRAQLEKLQSVSHENQDSDSAAWKAESQKGSNGKGKNIIRLRRMPKAA